MPQRNLLIITFVAIGALMCYDRADRNRFTSTLVEAMQIVQGEYIEEVDRRQLFENAMSGMVEGLDPYSAYISPRDYRQFVEGLDQEFGGIGIIVELNPTTNRLTVLSPLHDTPAYRAGIQAGDAILEIDGKSAENLSLRESVDLMRGRPGSEIVLSILRPGETDPITVKLNRAIIPIESVLGDTRRDDGTWDFQLQEDPRITYVRLTTFGEHTAEELRETLKHQPIDGLILDLRDNAGGLLTASVEVCDMFISSGNIVSTRGRDGLVMSPYDATPEMALPPEVPIVVLINHYTASAAEIVAACLQDHDRAVVIGERSWGKGTVQNIIQMEGGNSALKLTTASYWRPSGNNIHRKQDAGEDEEWGVQPNDDYEVKLTPEQGEQVRMQRRERDSYRRSLPLEDDTSTAPDADDTSTSTDDDEDNAVEDEEADFADEPNDQPTDDDSPADDEPFVDPQLQRAVEYLQKKLN